LERQGTTRGCPCAGVEARTGGGAMVIVINCPACGKRFEVAGSLAGRKSRCKQCGAVFPIPVPSAKPIETAPLTKPAGSGPTAAVSRWDSAVDSGARDPRSERADKSPPPATSRAVGSSGTIIVGCPQCRRRYEFDGLLAEKKSAPPPPRPVA